MKRFSIAIFSLVILFVLSTIIVVDETEQVVILQFGKPVQTITDPGLNFKFNLVNQSKLSPTPD